MRRKAGALVPLESAICTAAANLRRDGRREFHGYEMARHLGDAGDQRLLTAYGTLYRALGRLEEMGLLKSRREDPRVAARENRPLRKLYTLTGLGEEAALESQRAGEARRGLPWRRRPAPA